MSEKTLSEEDKKLHRNLAVQAFNATWDFIEKENKSADEISEMLNTAHASLYRWRKVGTPLNIQRGEWFGVTP
jgi:pterin-4a-carbinolamine dehydratase